MKIYIFGAGASLGSQGEIQMGVRAPLIDDLFQSAYLPFAEKVGLTKEGLAVLQKHVSRTKSLEKWLTEMWTSVQKEKSPQSKRALQMFFGRITFYIWNILLDVSKSPGLNVYAELVDKLTLKGEGYGFINFNYDTLLDKAYQDRGGVILDNSLNSYIKANYIKPHGSVNWFLQPRLDDPRISLYEQNADEKVRLKRAMSLFYQDSPISLENLVIQDPDHPDHYGQGFITSQFFGRQFFYPLILMPLSSKLYGHFDGFKNQIIVEGQKLLARGKEIYMIGYRAQDDIINELLESVKMGTVLHVVGTSNANKIRDRVINRNPNLRPGKIFTNGFEHFVQEL